MFENIFPVLKLGPTFIWKLWYLCNGCSLTKHLSWLWVSTIYKSGTIKGFCCWYTAYMAGFRGVWMIFAKCCWTTKGLSEAEMSTLGCWEQFSLFKSCNNKSNLVVIEFILTINNASNQIFILFIIIISIATWSIANGKIGSFLRVFFPPNVHSGTLVPGIEHWCEIANKYLLN